MLFQVGQMIELVQDVKNGKGCPQFFEGDIGQVIGLRNNGEFLDVKIGGVWTLVRATDCKRFSICVPAEVVTVGG